MIISVKHLFTKSNTLQGKCAKAAYTKTHLRWRFYDIHETFYIHAFIFGMFMILTQFAKVIVSIYNIPKFLIFQNNQFHCIKFEALHPDHGVVKFFNLII